MQASQRATAIGSIDSVSRLSPRAGPDATTSWYEQRAKATAERAGARVVPGTSSQQRALTARRPAGHARGRSKRIRASIGVAAGACTARRAGGRGGGRPKLRPGWRRPAGGRGGRCVTLAAPRPGRAIYPFMGTRLVFHAFVYIRTEGQRAHHIALLLAGSRRRRRSGTQGLGASAPGFPFRRPVALCLWSRD